MIAVPVAWTHFNPYEAGHQTGYVPQEFDAETGFVEYIDELVEFAGRNCYKAWGRKNPKTAKNDAYVAQIIDHAHFSVMEHGSVTFVVEGVSRALMAELTRHRHLSFSINSQRYINYAKTEPVIPPAIADDEVAVADLKEHYKQCIARYEVQVAALKDEGLNNKQAREAARHYLPECAPVGMVVTGNMRAWREVISKRWHVAADKEIQELARQLLVELKGISPACFQDYDVEKPLSYERGSGEAK
ncbi:FAD-dependent thymidylate synthase [Streptomyces sp. NPDC004732]|uniref:FAD-dependent thymidylate synthase n=1 Tax=Streptomyces sp. NPDC004732 TaxID=3154290 RepID=UPI0033A67936